MYDRRGKNLFKALILLHGQETSMDKSNLRSIVVCYQNRNPLQAFSGDNVISKVLKKLSLMKHGTVIQTEITCKEIPL